MRFVQIKPFFTSVPKLSMDAREIKFVECFLHKIPFHPNLVFRSKRVNCDGVHLAGPTLRAVGALVVIPLKPLITIETSDLEASFTGEFKFSMDAKEIHFVPDS